MRVGRIFASALTGVAMLHVFPAAASESLLPHRAVYDLSLAKASDRSGISGISGRMVYEFNGSACEGYTVTFRFVTQIDTDETSRVTDQQTTTYEDGDGKTFSFVTKSFIDQNLDKEVRGTATMEPTETRVEIEKPGKAELLLAKTQFPTQHLIELIDKAEKGETFYETTLYDGSDDGDKVMTTTVIIGKPEKAEASDPEIGVLDTLKPDTYWPVSIAYFEETSEGGEEVPVYSISFKLHENGLTRNLVMDYGEFSMKGKLVDLSMFKAPADCAN